MPAIDLRLGWLPTASLNFGRGESPSHSIVTRQSFVTLLGAPLRCDGFCCCSAHTCGALLMGCASLRSGCPDVLAQPWQRHVFHSWQRWSSCACHAREPQQSHWEREPHWVKFASMSISYLMSLRLAPLPFTKSFKSRIMRTWKAGNAMIEQTTWVRNFLISYL